MKDYLTILNTKQLDACTDTDGPSLIVAGAGSGKTRVLTSRIAYLINDCNVDPYNILAITFTNKAAKEMNDRLLLAVGEDAKRVTCKTFHSFCAFVLRNEIEVLPKRKRTFQIIDDDESETLIKEAMVSLNYDIKLVKPSKMASDISAVKAKVVGFDSFSDFMREKLENTMRVYNESLLKNNLLDFDDLLSVTIEVFMKHSEVLDRYQERYKYILVDEFQDSSNIQYDLISMLGDKYKNVFIVGDEDQSIYSFRGANIANIRKFMDDFRGYHRYILDQNYRSAPEILDVANNLISNNKDRIKKDLWSNKERKNGVMMKFFDSDKAESRFISETIKAGVASGKYSYKDYAILYRNNYLSRNFENDLIVSHIPYRVYSGLSFYKRKEVKDMMGYLRLVLNPNDFYSFSRVINSPKRGIGETTLKKIDAEMTLSGDLRQAVKDAEIYASTKLTLSMFIDTIYSLRDNFKDMELKQFFNKVYEDFGYKKYIDEIPDEDEKETRSENIEELLNAIMEVETIGSVEDTLSDFLQNVTLLTELDVESADDDHVSLITMHSAKGLEFKNVFASGLENDIIPGLRSQTDKDVEEERRLLYVCLTRAMDNLYITCATSRYKFGSMGSAAPSMFLRELGIKSRNEEERVRSYSDIKDRKERAAVVGEFTPGTLVMHDVFGPGKVMGQAEGFYIIKFDKFPAPKKVIINHPFLKKA